MKRLKHILRLVLECFVDFHTIEYWEWVWESEAERQAFIKYFRFCK